MKKFAILGYDTINIGDDIQSYVTSTLIKPSYIINRDDYEKVYSYETGELIELTEEVNLIMNGWFMHGPKWNSRGKPITGLKFPIKNNLINPIFISTCLSKDCNELFNEESINYLNKYTPILCRDITTLEMLKSKNVDSEYSGCLTQLLNIDNVPDDEEYREKYSESTFFVHGNDLQKFSNIKINSPEKHFVINHYIDELKSVNIKERLDAAEDLLMQYKYAKKIYTTRLHCFLPCRAMGLDVEYIGDSCYRTKDLISKETDVNQLLKTFENKIK